MSDLAVGSIDVGPPNSTGDNWQFGMRPAEGLDAAQVEILTEPEPSPSASDSDEEA
jgi:hypothetical protein